MAAEADPPTKRFKRNYEDTITVLVGPEEKRFLIHKEPFCSESSYFRSACSKDWEEGRQGVIRLPVHDVDSFHAFVHWVYAKEVDLPDLIGARGQKLPYPAWLSLGKLWALAHYLDHTRLRDATIDAILLKMQDHPGVSIVPESLVAIFDITPEKSTIQRLLSRFSAAKLRKTHLQRQVPKLPPALVHYLARKFLSGQSRPYRAPTFEERCRYHEHGKDEGCWDQKK